jgi:hypothetical protein
MLGSAMSEDSILAANAANPREGRQLLPVWATQAEGSTSDPATLKGLTQDLTAKRLIHLSPGLYARQSSQARPADTELHGAGRLAALVASARWLLLLLASPQLNREPVGRTLLLE